MFNGQSIVIVWIRGSQTAVGFIKKCNVSDPRDIVNDFFLLHTLDEGYYRKNNDTYEEQ